MWCVNVRQHDHAHYQPGPAALCPSCLGQGRLDVLALVRDYVDLENVLAEMTGGRAEHVGGTRELPVPLALGAEALQRDILHTLTTWEEIAREHCRLSSPPSGGRVRDGWAVQRAARLLAPRLAEVAAIGPTAVFPKGPGHEPDDMTGAEAIIYIGALHRTIGSAIGLRHLKHSLCGPCWSCSTEGGLRRDDGSETVYCALCGATTTWDDYQRDIELIVGRHAKKRR